MLSIVRLLAPLVLVFALAACDSASALLAFQPQCGPLEPLTATEVETIIAQAVARAEADGRAYNVTVVNRDGAVIGIFEMDGYADPNAGMPLTDGRYVARTKARTAAFLSSNQHSFNTRTAAFIIQDNFPIDVPNAPGGPLYGVQFSSLPCSDVVGESGAGVINNFGSGLRGELGSMPLYKNGCLIGGVAVHDGETFFTPLRITQDDGETYQNALPAAQDMERAAWTAAAGFRPDPAIFGSNIFIDGIRVEFMREMPPDDIAVPDFGSLSGTVVLAPVDAPPDQAFPTETIGGLEVEVRFPIVGSPLPGPNQLTAAEVRSMLAAGIARSDRIRAGIRRPLGTPMRAFMAVVDPAGNVLGCIRTPEATLFSFDVAIQKARTAAFFSDDAIAFTPRGIGFLSQFFFPPGIAFAPKGPLHGIQDQLNLVCDTTPLPLRNGITIFPGGAPVYKNGELVGAVGVSGDGVDQDDMMASAGAELFPPPPGVRADEADEADVVAHLIERVTTIRDAHPGNAALVDECNEALDSLTAIGLQGIRVPYLKFPRQPFID